MKGLKALCWMFGLPALVCGGVATWFLGFRELEVGDSTTIAAGSWVAKSEKDLREAESYILAHDDWGERELLRSGKFFQIDPNHAGRRPSVKVKVLAISADRRVAEVEVERNYWGGQINFGQRGFTFLDRLW